MQLSAEILNDRQAESQWTAWFQPRLNFLTIRDVLADEGASLFDHRPFLRRDPGTDKA
jgi:hypothetical protein